MLAEFVRLRRKEAEDGGSGGGAAEDRFTWAELGRKTVVRDELRRRYLVFDSADSMLLWCGRVPPAERCFHEVVFGSSAQRLRFDVDAPASQLAALEGPDLECLRRQATPMEQRDEPAEFSQNLDSAGLEELLDLLGEQAGPGPAGPGSEEAAPSSARSPGQRQTGPGEDSARLLVGALIEAARDAFFERFASAGLHLGRDGFLVCSSSGPTAHGFKHSFHISILPFAAADNEEAREFAADAIARLPAAARRFVDPGVYTATQCFRLAGSTKPGQSRFKTADAELARALGTAADTKLADALITAPPNLRLLPRLGASRAPTKEAAALETALAAAAVDLAEREGVTEGFALRSAVGGVIRFDRIGPSPECRLCARVHSTESSLFLSVAAVKTGGARVYEHCRRAGGRRRLVGELAGGGRTFWPAEPSPGRSSEAPPPPPTARTPSPDASPPRETGPIPPPKPPAAGGPAKREPVPEGPAPASDRLLELPASRASRGTAHRAQVPGAQEGPKSGCQRRIEAVVAALDRGAPAHDATLFERCPRARVYSEPEMADYELEATLAVQAQMKLGKTKALRRFIDAHFAGAPDDPNAPVVWFVTFRQTFGHAIAQNFPDFTLYSNAEGTLSPTRWPRLIVQAESMGRVQLLPGARMDLLVLDEAESVLAQFSSGLHRALGASFAAFQWLLRRARHVVCMDANLGDRTFRTLQRMRPQAPPFFHWNRFERAAGDRFAFTADPGAWLARLHAALDEGKRLVIASNSAREGKALARTLRARLGPERVGFYCAETPKSLKAAHFGDVARHWRRFDVLIYTPTCTAGVSFELEHFDALFGLFTSASCDVEACRQMMGRVRSLRDREHFILLDAKRAALPETVEGIRALLGAKRQNLAKSSPPFPCFEYDADGRVRLYETDFAALWFETARIANLSQNDFVRRFIRQVRDTGATVSVLEASPRGAEFAAAHRAAKRAERDDHAREVAEAPALEPDEAASIQSAISAQTGDVQVAERRSLERFRLCETFAVHGREIGPTFVERYHTPAAARVFQALRAIGRGPTALAAVEAMRRAEAARFVFASSRAGASLLAEHRDLAFDRTVYASEAHALALWLLDICGLRTPADKRRVHPVAFSARIEAALPALRGAEKRFTYEFSLRQAFEGLWADAAPTFLGEALRRVNAVLRKQYGVELYVRRDGLALRDTRVGRLFVRAATQPDDPRPWVPWLILPTEEAADRVGEFLESEFYARLSAAGDLRDAGARVAPSGVPVCGGRSCDETSSGRAPGGAGESASDPPDAAADTVGLFLLEALCSRPTAAVARPGGDDPGP